MEPAPKPHAGAAPTPERVLRETVRALERWEEGVPLQELVPRRHHTDVLRNGLLTLFRRQAGIDWIVDDLARRRVRPRLRRVLRWGVCELLYQRGLTAPVCVDVCAGYTKASCGAQEAGFVNAVLRRVAERPPAEWAERLAREAPPAVRLELGPELYLGWSARLAPADLEALAELLLTPAPVTVRRRAGSADATAPGLRPLPAPAWAPTAALFVAEDPAAFFASEAFARGGFYVQDPSTLLAPALLAAAPGERLADLCAAPGGKALLLAEAMGGQGILLLMDRSARRLRRLLENLGGQAAGLVVAGDAAAPPLRPGCCDAVLVDVPCSNTGVIRRRPDVRWRYARDSRDELAGLQTRILAGTAPLVRPGGRLVYSTCSIEPEENGEQVRRFLAGQPGFRLDAEQTVWPAPSHDGAYAARLVRKAG